MTDERITYEPYSGPDGSYIIATATLAEITPQKADGPTRAKATEALCLVLIDLCDVLYEDGEILRAEKLHIIFDGPPSHESGRFVEVEDAEGRSIRAGNWHERPDGLWALVIGDDARLAAFQAENAVLKEALEIIAARQPADFDPDGWDDCCTDNSGDARDYGSDSAYNACAKVAKAALAGESSCPRCGITLPVPTIGAARVTCACGHSWVPKTYSFSNPALKGGGE